MAFRIPLRLLDRACWTAMLALSLAALPLTFDALAEWLPRRDRVQTSPIPALIARAADLEVAGDLSAAERVLLDAARLDRRYATAWALANFYLRQNRRAELDRWLHRAIDMSFGDRAALFAFAEEAQLPRARERLAAAEPHLAGQYCERLIALARYPEALETWTRSHGPKPLLVNADLTAVPSGTGFDWRLGALPGISAGALTSPGHPGQIEARFSGDQADSGEVLSQYVSLSPATRYRLSFDYRTSDLAPPTGLRWIVESTADRSNALARAPEFEVSPSWTRVSLDFRASSPFARLALVWRRELGAPRLAGLLAVRNLALEPAP
ncbi:MAG: hypothetical protein SFV18_03395 [Bryobacteraceae bacterium]|nr:hypothetical protein [Bryobacteraceae bacterium]